MTNEERKQAFIADLLTVCKKHSLSLSHEDYHGGFLVEEYSERLAKWLSAASWSDWPTPGSSEPVA